MATKTKRSNPTMLIDERRQHMLEKIQREGRALVSELSDSLHISRITIRKDLDYLESRGLIQRSHGGALVPQRSTLQDLAITEKARVKQGEKQRIAKAAVAMVSEGDCVMLDSGTTTTAVARALTSFSRLTVITNAMNIAAELSKTAFEVILTGGSLRQNSMSLVGPIAEDTLRDVHADILFLGVDGFDPETGISTPNILESRVNRAMLKAARKVVVVCDSSKFNRRSLAVIAPLEAIHTVITDSGLDDAQKEMLEARDIQIIRV